MKKNKSLILYNQPHKGLSVPTKRDFLKIGLSIDEEDKKEYSNQRIKEQDETIKKLKDVINSLSGKRDELKYLKEFRNMFLMHCIKSNIRLTIIQCSNHIKKEGCKMKDQCKPRIEIIKRIEDFI